MSFLAMPLLDAVALGWFVLSWAGYNLLIDRIVSRPHGLNQHMQVVRQFWMDTMQRRGDRVIDAILIGHLIHSVSFFASATMLLIAALVGTLAGLTQAFEAVMSLSMTVKTTKQLFEIKVLLLAAVFVYAFFKFTWSLRQYNYVCALVGAMLPAPSTDAHIAHGEPAGRLLSLAVMNFNGGLRAYYFALAVLSWLIHPVAFIAVSSWMLLVLLRRQFGSRTLAAIRAFNDNRTKS